MITTLETRNQIIPLYDSKDDIQFFKGDLKDVCYRGMPILSVKGGLESASVHAVLDLPPSGTIYNHVTGEMLNRVESLLESSLTQGGFGVYKTKNPSESYAYLKIGDKYSEVFYFTAEVCPTLSWKNTCNDSLGYYGGVFENNITFNVAEQFYRRSEKLNSLINNLGVKVTTLRVPIKEYYIKMLVPNYMLDAFDILGSHDTIKITDGDKTYNLYDVVTTPSDENSYVTEIEISYKLEEDIVTINQCHSSIFAVDPDNGYGGYRSETDSNPPSITISENNGVLTASTTGTVYWELNNSYVGDGLTLDISNLGEGTFIATVIEDGQTNTASYEVLGSSTISVVLNTSGGVISSTISNGLAQFTYAWEYSADGINFASLTETSNSHVGQNSGYYKLSVTDSNNNVATSPSIYFDVVEDAAHTVLVTENGNILTATVSNTTDTITYEWYKQEGSVKTIISGETNETLQISSNGMYEGVGIVNGVSVSDTIVVLDFMSEYEKDGQYQEFTAIQGQSEFIVTDVDLPPYDTDKDELNRRYFVTLNGSKRQGMNHNDTINQYQYNLAEGHKLILVQIDEGDLITINRIKD